MAHQDRDNEPDERPSERRKREKDSARAHKTKSSRIKIIDPETGETIRSPHRKRKDKTVESEPTSSMSEIVPELARTLSAPGASSRSSLPYPSFSKAHSKEAVNSTDNIHKVTPANDPLTPDTTALGSEDEPRPKSTECVKPTSKPQAAKDARPPSPPDTEFSQRKVTPSRTSQLREEATSQSRSNSQSSHRSWFAGTSKVGFGKPKAEDERSKVSSKSKASKTSTTVKVKAKPAAVVVVVDDDNESQMSEPESESNVDSNATSIAPARIPPPPIHRGKTPALDEDSSPESAHGSSPRTPTATAHFPPHDFKPAPSPFVSFDIPDDQSDMYGSAMPPPPPPPPMVPMNIPRVDYLMQNGGLARPIPKSLLSVTPAYASQPQFVNKTPVQADVEKVFSPFYSLLDQYETVIAKNGSVAVATGYRSVARRLLDRLENVFARDLRCEGCFCVVCQQEENDEYTEGKPLGWGDVLEWVSGRRDLPAWPPFDFDRKNADEEVGLGIGSCQVRPKSPVKIDPDIDEAFHQHYLRQSKKTKATVDKWLNSTPGALSAPPPDIDDETLTFTMLTHLEPQERALFNALIAGSSRPIESTSRAPTPMGRPRTDLIIKTGLSLQRLYRLPTPPRDPESCMYLVNNPQTHKLLATLAEINPSEWEILISGRFDGFLWSGAEAEFPGSMLNSPAVSRNPTPAQMVSRGPTPAAMGMGMASRGPTPAQGLPSRGPTPAGRHPSFSRMTTPFSGIGGPSRTNTFSPPIAGFPSRGPTPSNFAPTSMPPTPFQGQGRHAVSNDEETEIAMLAEVEREIYAGMEALEDAFENLHRKAEIVRQALRQRGAGLSMMSQTRRGVNNDSGLFTRLGTPGLGERGWEGYGESEVDIESDWGGDDQASELAPDDSASNISSSRRRRPIRRKERSTPAPVEEEDEQ